MKKRPITANRVRNNFHHFNHSKRNVPGGPNFNKNQSSLDLEVSRMRPKNIKVERERLYDEALREKMIANLLKDENLKLKTKVHILETEIAKKDRLVDDLLLQHDPSGNSHFTNGKGAGSGAQLVIGPKATKLESHLTQNLKKKIRELQNALTHKTNEVEGLKR
jgi:hypothetical protein